MDEDSARPCRRHGCGHPEAHHLHHRAGLDCSHIGCTCGSFARWWPPAWAGATLPRWLGRLLGVHSPSRHVLGTCWCQAGLAEHTRPRLHAAV